MKNSQDYYVLCGSMWEPYHCIVFIHVEKWIFCVQGDLNQYCWTAHPQGCMGACRPTHWKGFMQDCDAFFADRACYDISKTPANIVDVILWRTHHNSLHNHGELLLWHGSSILRSRTSFALRKVHKDHIQVLDTFYSQFEATRGGE